MSTSWTHRESAASPPLSFAQQRLWFLDQIQGNSPVYNVYRAWRLSGALNLEALQRAIDTIVARHGVLRSTIKVVEGEPTQVTAAALSVPITIIDLQGLSSTEREAKSVQLAVREAKLPFDLAQGPLFRVKLMRLVNDEHLLLLTLHHIVADGWSLGVLHRELGALYEAFAVGGPFPLPDLPIQYGDYTLWQRECLQGDMLETQLAYWKKQLAGAPPMLELPTDRPRPAVQTFRGDRHSVVLSKSLIGSGNDLNTEYGISPQFEEVVMDAHLLDTEHLGPDLGERLLDRCMRSDKDFFQLRA